MCRDARCRSRARFGDPCTGPPDCLSGVCAADGYCTESCSSGGDCPHGTSCNEGTCEASSRGVLGSACASGLDCIGRRCLDGVGERPVCTRDCDLGRDDCPPRWRCESVGDGAVCTPPSTVAGCAVIRAGTSPIVPACLFLLVLVARLQRCRRTYAAQPARGDDK